MFRRSFLFLLVFAHLTVVPSRSQSIISENREISELLKQSIDSIYNLNFTAADVTISKLEKILPDYPGVTLLKAFYVNWKYRPIKKNKPAFEIFESFLEKGIEQSEILLSKNKDDMEASFFLLACHAYLAQLYSDNGMSLKALGEAKSAYKYIKLGFDYVEEYPEFYFSSGIYNYYREKYPQENPFYKPFLWFFRSGDMAEGLEMLKKGSRRAVFTQAECFTYLFHIYLRYEDNPQESIAYAQILKNKYPNNLTYLANYIENSIRINQFVDLLPEINRLMQSDQAFYQYVGLIFYGDYLVNKNQDLNLAIVQYEKADKLGDKDDLRLPHYDGMIYLGMGRAYGKKGNKELSEDYFKKSVKTAQYAAYRKDAELLLQN